MKDLNAPSLKNLTKSSAWELQENDIFRLINAAEKDIEIKENIQHYLSIVRSAFEIEEVKINKPEVINKYKARGFQVTKSKGKDNEKPLLAIKKKAIQRVTDLTYENIRHISATKLLEVLDRNFGGGWDSLSQSIKDIIEHSFDISTTTLPQNRLRNPGGIYEKMLSNGFEVLEIAKGTWVEAIFAKKKPLQEAVKLRSESKTKLYETDIEGEEDDDDDLPEIIDDENNKDDEDTFDEDKLTEESYRTTFDEEDGLDLADEESDVEDDF